MIKAKINNKYELYLPEHRADRKEWDTYPYWEYTRIESMLANIEKGDLVLDIGTEEGDISALLAQKSENIILIEPNEKAWPNVKAIWDANGLIPPKAVFVGFASNKDQFYNLQIVMDGNKRWVLNPWPECAFGELIGDHGIKELDKSDGISEIKVDTLIENMKFQSVKLVTIDVDGSELEVIRGMVNLLLRDRPLVYLSIHPELMYANFKQFKRDLFEFMRLLKYNNQYLDFDHEDHYVFWPVGGKRPIEVI